MSSWISVKDRMPIYEYKEFKRMYPNDGFYEEDFKVIVMIEGASIPTVLCTDGIDFWEIVNGYCQYYDVTHWQPLPEPPKGDVDNGNS